MPFESFESLSVIRQKYCCPMNFGVAMDASNLGNSNFTEIIPYVFDSITCENNMKPNFIRTDSGATTANYTTAASYNYSNADAIVNFAKNNNMKMLGHVLWYDANTPKFVRDLQSSQALTSTVMTNILNSHTSNLISHFNTIAPNNIIAWQVANEALDPDGTPIGTNIGKRVVGDEYFRSLFENAQSNLSSLRISNVKLFYNDTAVLSNTGIFNTLKGLKEAGFLDGIGLQCHSYPIDTIERITLKYIEEGFEVHFTEVDCLTTTANDTGAQVNWFRGIIRIALKYGVRNFTVWGLTDDTSWRASYSGRTQYPLLFTSAFLPKHCYDALINEMKIFGTQLYDVIIVLGQSNSDGFGITEYTFDNPAGGTYDMKTNPLYKDDFDDKFDERIRAFSYDNRIVPAFNNIDHLDNIYQNRKQYGFGVSFARQYIKEEKLADGRKILLIGSGWSGTGFLRESLGSNRWDISVTNSLYHRSLARIKRALGGIAVGSTVKAILWHQGESDIDYIHQDAWVYPPVSPVPTILPTEYPTKYNIYKTKVGEMLRTLRSNITSTTIPILMGGLCPSGYVNHKLSDTTLSFNMIESNYKKTDSTKGCHSYYEIMNRLIEEVTNTATNINFKFVPSVIIPEIVEFNHHLKGDVVTGLVHFNKTSQIEYGKRYFYIYNDKITTILTTILTRQSYDIFIVLGQSNSSGRGSSMNTPALPTAITSDDISDTPNDAIKQWNGSSIIPASERLFHFDGGGSTQWGFGTSFARQYLRENKLTSGNKVLLIGCGCGGTAVLHDTGRCGSNSIWNSSSSGLFPKSVTRITEALEKVGPNSVLKGILWHQGESDAHYINNNQRPTHTFTQYESTLTSAFNTFRYNITSAINRINTVNQTSISVPILMGGIMPGYGNYDTMTRSIKNIVDNATTENYLFVPSAAMSSVLQFNHNLEAETDHIHFSKSSQIEFGKRYFYIYNGNSIKFN